MLNVKGLFIAPLALILSACGTVSLTNPGQPKLSSGETLALVNASISYHEEVVAPDGVLSDAPVIHTQEFAAGAPVGGTGFGSSVAISEGDATVKSILGVVLQEADMPALGQDAQIVPPSAVSISVCRDQTRIEAHMSASSTDERPCLQFEKGLTDLRGLSDLNEAWELDITRLVSAEGEFETLNGADGAVEEGITTLYVRVNFKYPTARNDLFIVSSDNVVRLGACNDSVSNDELGRTLSSGNPFAANQTDASQGTGTIGSGTDPTPQSPAGSVIIDGPITTGSIDFNGLCVVNDG